MKKLLLLLAAFLIHQGLSAQGVGINTSSPDPGAALEIKSENKGLLIPRVNLQSKNDNSTMLSPPRGLLVFNTNINMYAGVGFYYNDNNVFSPDWINLSKQFELPIGKTVTTNTVGLDIANFGATSSSTAIRGHHGGSGIGVRASSISGLGLDVSGGVKIAGNGQSPAMGKVLTSDASGNATWEGAVAFSASGVASPIIASFVDSKIAFLTVNYDLGGNYKSSNQSPHSTFTVPRNGIYHFDVVVDWAGDPLVAGRLQLNRTRNGVTTILAYNSYEGRRSIVISADYDLITGDIIFVSIYQGTNSNQPLVTNDNQCRFSGRLVTIK